MRLEIYRSLWGVYKATDGLLARSPHTELAPALLALKNLGYTGIETTLKHAMLAGPDFKRITADLGLKVIFQVFTDGPVCPGDPAMGGPFPGFSSPCSPLETSPSRAVASHLQAWKEQVEAAQDYGPEFVNTHPLRDYFTVPMAEDFFQLALAWETAQGYRVTHETHRKRFFYSPWVAREFIPRFPSMKVTLDVSHWLVVAETDTTDPVLDQVVMDLASRVHHVHCRVGYDHGPQVPDPRAAEWLPYMEGHERWWDAVWAAQKARGEAVSSTRYEKYVYV